MHTYEAVINIRSNPNDGRWYWGVAYLPVTAPLDSAETVAGSAPCLADACVNALEQVTSRLPDTLVALHSNQQTLIETLAASPELFPLLRPRPSVVHRAWKSAKAAKDVYEAEHGPPVPTVEVATDGSWSRGTRTGGWAFVSSTGEFGTGSAKPLLGSYNTEVTAIVRALYACKGRKIVILSDCENAIRDAQLPPDQRSLVAPSQMRELWRLVDLRGPTFRKVAAHSGHPLNEAADRLATLTRRCHEMDLPQDQQRKEEIVAEYVVAWNAGLQVEASSRPVPSL